MKKVVKNKVNKNVDGAELIMALNELEEQERIDKNYMLEAIENALVTAYKKNQETSSENVRVEIDRETGETHLYQVLNVVAKGEDEKTEISTKDAKEIKKTAKAGSTVEIEIKPKDFGRIAAQTAKQVIVQKIREASRENIMQEFTEKKGEIITGIIQKADRNIVVLDLGRVEGIMPTKEQIPTEHYSVNQKIRTCITSVEKGLKGAPQIIVSRASNEFVRKLFELEIPEIYEGLIEIKSISRDPGKRCKVAVYSPNENIDPVGSCVGQKGVRIQNIINELNGEKMDIIEWNEDPMTFIAEALLPAQVLAVDLKEEEKFAQVIVADDQLSLAIGKSGQNARLAAKLTQWKIDIKSESQFREIMEKMQTEVENNVKDTQEEVVEESAEEVIEEVVEEKEEKKATKKKATTKKSKEENEEDEVEEKETKKKSAKKETVSKKTTTKKKTSKKEEK